MGYSDFDSHYPWNMIQECNIRDGEEAASAGDPSFSREDFDTIVILPKFWYHVENDAERAKRRFFVADGPMPGFSIHPAFSRGDGVIREYCGIAKYETGIGHVSRSGVPALVNSARADFRAGACAKGSHWRIWDVALLDAVRLLYLVEYADLNSQAVLGAGVAADEQAHPCGESDSLPYHSGTVGLSREDSTSAVQYRGIENLWGNTWGLLDGLNFYEGQPFLCTDSERWADDTDVGYTKLSFRCPAEGAWIKTWGFDPDLPWLMLPDQAGGSEDTYVCDYWFANDGWRIAGSGGRFANGGKAGLFTMDSNDSSTYVSPSVGSRLSYLP
jgi:hypothetical protein